MLTKVYDKEISIKEKTTWVTKNLPYGMVVWSTGIGTRAVIIDFLKQIGKVPILIIFGRHAVFSRIC